MKYELLASRFSLGNLAPIGRQRNPGQLPAFFGYARSK